MSHLPLVMSTTTSFHQEKEQKIDHCSSAAKDMEPENVCKNCGIDDHMTEYCRSGFYGRLRKYDRNTISFSNLPPDTDGDDLERLCIKYGPVPRSAGPADIKGVGDQGLVAFENKEDAQMAVEKLNGSTYKGCVITVKWDSAKSVRVLPENRCKRCGKTDGHLENDCPSIVFNPIGKYT
ncbi:hypothetical protein MKW94_004767 [Papaver nudicaule]|uniref:RRM domain-containing protein n=1 Tax=Papaver nudicaule TaxID=74823 RepID=A0AA41VG59_PAPNU|nr:hypothetical protein [Papaver nudicaule]